MEIIKKMNVPAAFFYNQVIDSVQYDIREATGKTVPETKLAGFDYVKEFSNSGKARITINEVEKDRAYSFTTATTKNSFTVSYEIKPIDEKSCEVRYVEKMESFGMIQSLNDMAVGILLGFLKKRRFKKMLQMMEEAY